MYRCVCIWQYILQNYNYKLHFQNLSIYHILHVFIVFENLDVCTACDPWDSNIQLTMVKDRRWQIYPVADIDIKILGVPSPRLGMPFLDNDTCAEAGVIYLCHGFLPCERMDGWMDRSCEKASRKTITTSFTICNMTLHINIGWRKVKICKFGSRKWFCHCKFEAGKRCIKGVCTC